MSDEGSRSDPLTRQLAGRWADLLPDHPDIGRDLITRYGQPTRFYHNGSHLARVLIAVDELADEAADLDAVRLAAWFHDAVYDVHASDNEEQSARLAQDALSRTAVPPERIAHVARLVRLTATHAVEPGDRSGAVLCDADLSILASPVEVYNRYASDVRLEYAHVPDADFRVGRAAVLRQLLALPRLFATARAHDRWEARARRNVEGELAWLIG